MAVNPVNGSNASQVAGAIQQAAHSTGTSFEYLLTTARIESNLNPQAQAATTSARGLYQFIDQTWLSTMKQAGPALGFGQYSDAIVQGPDGHYGIPDPAMRAAIMKLRGNPAASAIMAGAFTRNNSTQLSAVLGRPPTEGELYIAHFLGSDGAQKLIGAATRDPKAIAADMFPAAAAANRSVFYNRYGRARGAGEVYAELTGRFATARESVFSSNLRGTIMPNTANIARAPDTAGVTGALAAANADAPPLPDTKPLFQAMFTDRRRLGVAPVVGNLWAPGSAAANPAAATETAAPSTPAPVQPLDLFTDGKANVRKIFGGDT